MLADEGFGSSGTEYGWAKRKILGRRFRRWGRSTGEGVEFYSCVEKND